MAIEDSLDELTGLYNTISGDLSGLTDRVDVLDTTINLTPSLTDFSNYTSTVNANISAIQSINTSQQSEIDLILERIPLISGLSGVTPTQTVTLANFSSYTSTVNANLDAIEAVNTAQQVTIDSLVQRITTVTGERGPEGAPGTGAVTNLGNLVEIQTGAMTSGEILFHDGNYFVNTGLQDQIGNHTHVIADTTNLETVLGDLTGADQDTNFHLNNVSGYLDDVSGDVTTNATSITTNAGDIDYVQFELGNLSGFVTTVSGQAAATELNGLTDVVITGPASGDLLEYDGNTWVNTGDLGNEVAANTANIATNVTDIATNAGDIDYVERELGNLSGHSATASGNAEYVHRELGNLSGHVSTISGSVDTNTTNISTNTTDIATNAGDIDYLELELGNLSGHSATASGNADYAQDELGNLSGFVAEISGSVDTNTTNISTNTTNISTNTTDIATNVGDIAYAQAELGNLSGFVSTISGDVDTNTTNISTNSSNITTNAADIDYVEFELGNLSGFVSTVSGNANTNGTDLDYTHFELGNLSGFVSEISGSVDTNTTNISSNDDDIATNAGDIGYLELELGNLSGHVTTVSGVADLNDAEIVDLSNSIDHISGQLTGHGERTITMELGQMPASAGTTLIPHGLTIDFDEKVEIYGSMNSQHAQPIAITLPYLLLSPLQTVALSVTDTDVQIINNVDFSNFTGYCRISYTPA